MINPWAKTTVAWAIIARSLDLFRLPYSEAAGAFPKPGPLFWVHESVCFVFVTSLADQRHGTRTSLLRVDALAKRWGHFGDIPVRACHTGA